MSTEEKRGRERKKERKKRKAYPEIVSCPKDPTHHFDWIYLEEDGKWWRGDLGYQG